MAEDVIRILTGGPGATGAAARAAASAAAGPADEAPAGRKGVWAGPDGGAVYFDDAQEAAQVAAQIDQLEAWREVPRRIVEDSLAEQLRQIEAVLVGALAKAQLQAMAVDEVQVTLGISVEGAIGFQGVGAKGTGSGAMVLKFKPKG